VKGKFAGRHPLAEGKQRLRRVDRIPTKTKSREEYLRDAKNAFMSNSDFSKAPAVAGLAWLPVRS